MKRSRTVVNLIVIAVFTAICVIGMEYLAVNIGQGVPFTSNYTVHTCFAAPASSPEPHHRFPHESANGPRIEP